MAGSSSSPTRSNQSGVATGELSEWVNRVRSGSQASGSHKPTVGDSGEGAGLEEEVRQSRINRQNRKHTASSYNEASATGGEVDTADGRVSSPSSPGKQQRGSALLARYGGAAGPTGTANPGTSGGGPVSLASFMGGKAAGPRMGKLTGDGRSAPPEAALIDDSRRHLPGMGQGGASRAATAGEGRSLASFLQERASAKAPDSSIHADRTSSLPSSAQANASDLGRAPSPTRFTRTTGALPPSPERRAASPSRGAFLNTEVASPVSKSPTLQADRPSFARAPSSNSSMKHVSTSPIRPDHVTSGDYRSIQPSTMSVSQSPQKQASFSSLNQTSSSDRLPTASLTRLKGQGVVGQRLKEAMERQSASDPSPSAPSPISIPRQSESPRKWTVTEDSSPSSPTKRTFRMGAALPGMSNASPSAEARASMRSPSPTRDERQDAAPFRLPGMGGAQSPFGASGGRASEHEAAISPLPLDSNGEKNLEHLTKARVRGPARRTPRGGAAAAEPSEISSNPVSATESTAPRRSTSGPRIVVFISGGGTNLQALIDATHVQSTAGPLAHAQISHVLANTIDAKRGMRRASTANPPISNTTYSIKKWKDSHPEKASNAEAVKQGYDEELARLALQGDSGSTTTRPDLIVFAGFMRIVSPYFLRALGHKTDLPASGAPAWSPKSPVPAINLHPALPTEFDGKDAIKRAWEAFQKGEITRSGVMVHEVVAEVDRGEPIQIEKVPFLLQGDSLEQFEARMHAVEHRLIVAATAEMLERAKSGRTQTQAVDDPSPRRRAASPVKRNRRIPLAGVEAVTLPNLSGGARDTIRGVCARKERPVSGRGTVALEALLIQSDGATIVLPEQEAHVLHEGEVQAVLQSYKGQAGVETILYLRSGAEASASSNRSCQRAVEDLAAKRQAKVVNAGQGREPAELAALFPNGVLETRLGSSRRNWSSRDSTLWRVSCPALDATFVDQVELSRSSLCSASSYVLSLTGDTVVWHGHGSLDCERSAAERHAQHMSGRPARIMEEGQEDSLWKGVVRGSEAHAQAWHHRRRRLWTSALGDPSMLQPRLLTVNGGHDLEHHSGESFTSSDIRTDGVSIILLPEAEVYVLVGPDARSKRRGLACALQAADELAGSSSASSSRHRLPVHVVVYPSLTPKDLSGSLRYWSRYEADLRRRSKRLNVVSLERAKKELLEVTMSDEVDARLVEDRQHLPVGLGEEHLPRSSRW